MGSVNLESIASKMRSDVVEWLNYLFPEFDLHVEASEEELRAKLADGVVFLAILKGMNPGGADQLGDYVPEKRLEYVARFASAAQEMELPSFKVLDIEQEGSMSSVVTCLLSLRDHLNSSTGNDKTTLAKSRSQNRSQSKPQVSEPSIPPSCHAGHKFHEIFHLREGRYSDLPAAKISEMINSNSLDSAPTQSLLSVANGILDENIERKNGDIPQRVACLLKKVVQEIERRISSQAEHIRNQNNLIKAREEKYRSRIRVLETLASGESEETKIVMEQLRLIKIEKSDIEESKKLVEQDLLRLMKEKGTTDHKLLELQHRLETTKNSYEQQYQLLEANSNTAKLELEENIQELQFLLVESRRKTKELEEFSESKFQSWNRKQHIFHDIIGSQLLAMKNLKASSESIKNEVISTKHRYNEELNCFGQKLKVVTDTAKNYHTVIAENRKLFNEVQELKGNIRVFCRIRPFLSGENRKSTTIDYIGENGELLLANPSKQGKDAHRTFQFNKVFGPLATQEEVFLDIQPLIRSVLDGYNVCIFAYGQTGSGKTYTMTGPNSSTQEDWGVNYRALNDLFHISRNRRDTIVYEVGVQMVEIYNEQVRDLLLNDAAQKKLGVLNTSQPNGLAVPDASMHPVNSTSDVVELMQIGLANRAIGATALNERSSRSHSVVTVHVRGSDKKTGATLRGSLHLVDLAGSERVDRSEVTGDRLREAQHINKSLSSLGDVIFALSKKSSHVPYRNSKLTQVLQSSLGGQAKTLMFVQINPDTKSYSETFSTLKFAERVSGIELGAARSSKESKDIRDLMEQVASLKGIIARKDKEIKSLQLSKGSQTPNGSNGLRHSSSSPSFAFQGKKLPVGQRKTAPKAASDPGNLSDYSDKNSEASSQQSMDDFSHRKENIGKLNLEGDETGQSSTDVGILEFGDADSEERLSDMSDGGLSMGEKTVDSTNNTVAEYLFSRRSKIMQFTKEKPVVPSQVPRPTPQKVQRSLPRAKSQGTLRSLGSMKSTTGQVTSSTMSARRRL